MKSGRVFAAFVLVVAMAAVDVPLRAAEPTAETVSANGTSDTKARLRALHNELVRLGREQQSEERNASDWRAKLVALNARQVDLDKRMDANRDSLVRFLGALELYRRNPPPALLVNPRSARQSVTAALLMQSVLPELERRRQVYLAEQEELNKIRRAAALASAGLFSIESAEADRLAKIERLSAAKAGLETVASPQGAANPAPDATLAQAQDVNALVGRLRLRETPQQPVSSPLSLQQPVEGALIRRFGQTIIHPGEDRRRSKGLFWRTAANASVNSPTAGDIDYAGPIRGLDQVIILRANSGYRVVLTGLGRLNVKTGEHLEEGEPVGRMASERQSELYLELRRDTQVVDPLPWLKRNG